MSIHVTKELKHVMDAPQINACLKKGCKLISLIVLILCLIVLMLCSGQNLSIINQFLYTAPLLIKIYLPMKFQVDTSYSFCVMLQTQFKYEK